MGHYVLYPSDMVLSPRLSKYSGFTSNFYKSLCSQELYFSNPTTFNDPFEPAVLVMEKTNDEFLISFLANTIMSCLCIDSDNLKLWSYYADGLRGICIEFDSESLIQNLCKSIQLKYNSDKRIKDYGLTTDWLYGFYVKYSENNIPLDFEEFLGSSEEEKIKFFATKPKIFEGENELRLAILPKKERDPTSEKAGQKWFSKNQGFKYEKSAIKSVIFGEKADFENIKAVKNVLGDSIDYKMAFAQPDNYSIKLKPLD